MVAAAPGASSTGLLDSTSSTGDIPLSMKAVLPVFSACLNQVPAAASRVPCLAELTSCMALLQSAEDGTMPLLQCMYDPAVQV